MPRKKHTSEEIIQHLRTVELEQSKGLSLELAAKKIGVCTSTLVRWKKEYNGLEVNQLKRLKGLEKENARLKRVVAEQAVDISILKDVASGNF
jgi:putative transposase